MGALTELQLQVSIRAVLDLLFAFLSYPSKLWEIGKKLELGMVVLPVGFTLRVGEEKTPVCQPRSLVQ